MRLTADIILRASSRFNPLNQRELELRGFKIPAIENLAVTQDQYDVIDFSDNELRKIDNLPRLLRLITLNFNNNSIRVISPEIGEKCPKLETLILTNNRIPNLAQIDSLAGCQHLQHLSLVGNPVTHQDNYRLYVIHKLPGLRSLDFRKVSRTEREQSALLFASKEGRALKESVAQDAKSFTPGENVPTNGQMTEDQKRQIREAISNASTPAEVDRIERQLRAGTFPFASAVAPQHEERKEEVPPASPMKRQAPAATTPPTTPAAVATPNGRPRKGSKDATPTPETPMQTEESPQQKQKRSRTDSVSSNKSSGRRKSVSEAAPSTTLTPQSAKKLKVAELKSELQARGLPTDGLKADLLERLLGNI